MPRKPHFNCGHEGARAVFVGTFSAVKRAFLCLSCETTFNEDPKDPRYVAQTRADASAGACAKVDTERRNNG